MKTFTLEELLPADWGEYEFSPFEPCASYSAPMDCIVYLREDVSYRADRVDQFLTILWHPADDRVVGVKLKGIRFLFDSLRSIVRTVAGKDLSEDTFVPLLGAIELALTMRLGSPMSGMLEENRSEEFTELRNRYELARGIVDGVTFDSRRLRQIAI